MYCSRCGKKVLDSMLYCPFCGAEIIIPEQEPYDGAGAAQPEPVKVEPVFSFEMPEEPESEPVKEAPVPETRLPWEEPGIEPAEPIKPEEPKPEKVEEPESVMPVEPEPEIEESPEAPPLDRRPASIGNVVPGRRSNMTRVPDSTRAPDRVSMFMDDEDDFDDDSDDFDDFEEALERQARRDRRAMVRGRHYAHDDDDDEDDDEDDEDDYAYHPGVSGFIFRHIRSIVGILLFVVLLAILAFYALSDSGQMSLAKINATLPLRAEIYSRVAFNHYQSGEYAQSGTYYERALARDPGNYNYASSAAMAYLAGGNNDRAAEMLRRCIQIRPEAVEPYVYLLGLYPNANSRPWDVAQLLKQGYQLTGDSRLEAAANENRQG